MKRVEKRKPNNFLDAKHKNKYIMTGISQMGEDGSLLPSLPSDKPGMDGRITVTFNQLSNLVLVCQTEIEEMM